MNTESWESVKAGLLKNPIVKEEYDSLELEYQIASQIIGLRLKKGLTQAQLAAKMGTKQSEIARIESGTRNLSINALEKIAEATGARLQVTLAYPDSRSV